MGDILHAFGIQYELILAQIFNFLILMGALWYFLYTPVLNILREREEKIRQGIEDAVAAQKARETTEVERGEVIREAHLEATQIVKRALSYAEERQLQLLSEAEEKMKKEREQLTLEAKKLKEKTLKESEAEIAKLAILAAERILKRELSK